MNVSAHAHFEAVQTAETVAPNATWFIAIEGNGQPILVERDRNQNVLGIRIFEERTWNIQNKELFSEVDFMEKGSICVMYLYRDAHNNKYRGSAVINGPFKKGDLDLICSSSTSGDDFLFIPSGIGLEDAQKEPLINEVDHVWHEMESITLSTDTCEHGVPMSNIRPKMEKVLEKGQDIVGAMERLWWEDEDE